MLPLSEMYRCVSILFTRMTVEGKNSLLNEPAMIWPATESWDPTHVSIHYMLRMMRWDSALDPDGCAQIRTGPLWETVGPLGHLEAQLRDFVKLVEHRKIG